MSNIPHPQCNMCGTTNVAALLPTKSWFMPTGYANLCVDCALSRIDHTQLNEVDRLCQYLNVPFVPNDWHRLYKRNTPEQALRTYVAKHADIAYTKLDWGEQQQALLELADQGLQDTAIEELEGPLYERLRDQWGDLQPRALRQIEALFCNSLSDYDVKTTQQRDLLKKMSQLSYMLDAQLQQGLVDKDMMAAYNKQFETVTKTLPVTSGGSNMSSLSELVAFIERNGFHPNPIPEVPNDELDMMEHNLMDYQRALITNDPGIAELYENRKRLRDRKKE